MRKLRPFVLISLFLICLMFAQNPDYAFYSEDFRPWLQSLPRDKSANRPAAIEAYASRLANQGVARTEIDRRLTLIRNSSQELENDWWNRYFSSSKSNFNREPNAFLVESTRRRTPGTALDMGAGDGRNSLYLAGQGWTVTAVDPAEGVVGIIKKRAQDLGVKVTTVVSTDEQYDYGREKWDLIVLSWIGPLRSPARVIEGLKRGGLVVVEGRQEWFGINGLLKAFPQLRVLHYQDVRAASDFFNRQELQVVRFSGEKLTVQ